MIPVITIFILGLVLVTIFLKSRNIHLWILSHFIYLFSKKANGNKTRNIYLCLADHYEPYYQGVNKEKAHQRVQTWMDNYRKIARKHTDSRGRHPQHTYFFPEEEYDEWVLNEIQAICDDGLGDVEVHLHHDNDTAENLETTLNRFKKLLNEKHGLLRKNEQGEIVYGFIHGNWALDNSRPDGRWCGIDNEIEILLKTGCVFDMTMPSSPSDTQTSTINSIYFAKEDGFCKSHDKGRRASTTGPAASDDELLMIQGPLGFNWRNRKLGLIPRIESGELSFDAPPTSQRVKLWGKIPVFVTGGEEHVFIKLHTHGLQDENINMFFNLGGLDTLWSSFEREYKDVNNCRLHYVTAWEMYEKVTSLIGSKA